jgi:hypothetical protein
VLAFLEQVCHRGENKVADSEYSQALLIVVLGLLVASFIEEKGGCRVG